MDILGAIIGGFFMLLFVMTGVYIFWNEPGYILVAGGIVLAAWIIADSLFHIR